jgi:hypothetical protein
MSSAFQKIMVKCVQKEVAIKQSYRTSHGISLFFETFKLKPRKTIDSLPILKRSRYFEIKENYTSDT